MDPSYTPQQLAVTANDLMASKMFSLASCVMLFYDIAITFGDEVEKVWKQPFTGATVLWYLNRYLSPLGYIVVIVAFNDPNWGVAACDKYVLYPEILKVFTATTVGIIFTLRLYAIYGRRKSVLYIMLGLLAAELAVKIWAFTDGVRLVLPPGFVGCILTGRTVSSRFVYTWVAELCFDFCVFIATVSRTIVLYRRHRHGSAVPLIKVMMRDGVVYFAVIFASNVVTVTLFTVLPPDLMAINATFSSLITSLMVSRLILNLRGEVLRPRRVYTGSSIAGLNSTDTNKTRQFRLDKPSRIIGNLGRPVVSFWSCTDDDNMDIDDMIDVDDLDFDFSDPDPVEPPSPYKEHEEIFRRGREVQNMNFPLDDRPRSGHGRGHRASQTLPRIVVEVVEDVTIESSSPLSADILMPDSSYAPREISGTRSVHFSRRNSLDLPSKPEDLTYPWHAPNTWLRVEDETQMTLESHISTGRAI